MSRAAEPSHYARAMSTLVSEANSLKPLLLVLLLSLALLLLVVLLLLITITISITSY